MTLDFTKRASAEPVTNSQGVNKKLLASDIAYLEEYAATRPNGSGSPTYRAIHRVLDALHLFMGMPDTEREAIASMIENWSKDKFGPLWVAEHEKMAQWIKDGKHRGA